MSEHQTNYFVQLTNTDFLKLLLQTDQKYRDIFWVYQMKEHISKMSSITGTRLLKEEELVRDTERNLETNNLTIRKDINVLQTRQRPKSKKHDLLQKIHRETT
jgi:hypothetical protein